MSTTTIRLPEDLKKRVARAAERADTTAHGFILEAIAEKVTAQERYDEFHDLADSRYAEIVASGETVSWKAMRGYLEGRASGKPATRPAAKKVVP